MTPEEYDLQYQSQHAYWQKDHDRVMADIDQYDPKFASLIRKCPNFSIDSDTGVITVARLFGNQWIDMEDWLEKQGAVLAGGEYVGPSGFYGGKLKVATRWQVTPELATVFLLRWS